MTKAQEFKKKYEGMTLKAVARKMVQLRSKHQKLKDQAAEVWHEVDYLRQTKIVALMEEMGTDNIKLTGIGRVTIRSEASCSTLNKEALYDWLEKNGHDELMSNTVNSSTLKAFVLNQLREGEPVPDSDIIKLTMFEMATITKN